MIKLHWTAENGIPLKKSALRCSMKNPRQPVAQSYSGNKNSKSSETAYMKARAIEQLTLPLLRHALLPIANR